MKKTTILLSAFLLTTGSLFAQADKTYQHEDDRQRGYHTRPWLRYEAEIDKCETRGEILLPSFENAQLQSEATNQVAVNLVNKGDYVEWTNEKAANAMTIRFSLPDNATSSIGGTGTTGNLGLYVNGEKVKVYQSVRGGDGIDLRDNIQLDSYWAWQYFNRENVAYEIIKGDILRMRFDEVILRTEEYIPANATFKIVKEDDNITPYTIDFVELEKVEPVTYESIDTENKVKYEGDGSDLQAFVSNNAGKTIYIPEGKYIVPVRLEIDSDNTSIQGAGIFFTELFFSAELNNSDYWKRGFGCSKSNVSVSVKDLYVNTILNQRYYKRDVRKQPGKGFNGSFGTNSLISNVLVQHFECGAWFDNANELHISNSRFRNNYADGTNLASASKNCIVEYCSYRNNGDDDMAAWSSGGLGENITYQYNTSELCWRAAGIGFFGGKQHKAHHCLVIDPIEIGIRIDASFGGEPYSNDGFIEIYDNSVYKGGTDKNVWGNHYEGAIYITLTGAQYDIQNISFENIDIIESKEHAISINNYNNSSKTLKVCFKNIKIDGVNKNTQGNNNGLFISPNVNGAVYIKDFTFNNVMGQNIKNNSLGSAKFEFREEKTENDPCEFDGYQMYTITVKSSDTKKGKVSGSGNYLGDKKITLSATPKTGYKFVKWDDESKENPYEITVLGNKTYIAIFEEDTDGVEDAEGSEFRVYAEGGSVYVENAKYDISLWNALGRKVTTAGANDSAIVQIPVPSSGVYIVKCGSNAYKIMINK